jgi:hypothetical protein
MEKQRAKAAERARRKIDREANPTGYVIEAFDPDEETGEPEESGEETPETHTPETK